MSDKGLAKAGTLHHRLAWLTPDMKILEVEAGLEAARKKGAPDSARISIADGNVVVVTWIEVVK